MWVGLEAVIHGIVLVVSTVLLLLNTFAEAENTTTLNNVLSSIVTEPRSMPPSSVAPFPFSTAREELATIEDSMILQETTLNSTALHFVSEPIPKVSKTRAEISTQISSNVVHVKKALSSVYRVQSSPHIVAVNVSKMAVTSTMPVKASHPINRQETSTILMPEKERGTILKSIQTNLTAIATQPKVSIPMASFPMPEQSSVESLVHPGTNVTDSEKRNRDPVTVPVLSAESKITMKPATLSIAVTIASDDASNFFTKNMSHTYTKIEASAISHKTVSEKPNIQVNASTRISFVVKQTNRTVYLHPSPSLVMKQNQSNINVAFTKTAPNMTHSRELKGSVFPSGNDTKVLPGTSKGSPLLTYNHTMEINATKEKWPDKTVSRSKMIHTNVSKAMQTKVNVLSSIPATFNNQTRESLNNFTTYRMIRPSSSVSSFSKTVTNGGGKIQEQLSMTKVSAVTVSKVDNSDMEITPTSTSSFSTTVYSIQVPTKPTFASTKLKEQQFSCTIKIISEAFKEEYTKSARAFMEKSKEIAEQFDEVFKNMPEYLYTEVLKFFEGSLACDVVIHTESKDSQPVKVEQINNILNRAQKTKGGFGKFEVGEIEVNEKDPDADEEDEKERWGRIPIIIISVLGGVCLVLFVIVISQCVSK